ncbi:uncharacterized protein SPPG_06311 [Spizellomyces punctatus DAOM BR117]|uniref:Ribosomal eL28/Mak16 domain-containing protein n=1 Tax=Spizellomyces punctatus (strain DAOM BR117) TaxID=645134 RepID=A0A0L0HCL8_SPIPD|nr:uncharacterized protein SPPG_06311 [Spizellomyces punctatus DAOM BR117]KNC98629.1 hypothetical protein SPPG_06311 [Spizellomyces punctatus DAOM BR117]|eukprot:XP_016606669.1 hypothetical protein SPPG_06311 [Spizellomyces punctatus DAOM BR117]
MSSDLIWLLTRDQSAFLVKRNGVQLSREPGNLLNRNSLKYSGLAQKKTIDISTAGTNGAVVSVKKTSVPASKPSKSVSKTTLKKSTRAGAKSVRNIIRTYRPDLEKAALARLSRVLESQKPGKVNKPKKLRGAKARKATTA